jgi:TP901 family phage tail tape measure protein
MTLAKYPLAVILSAVDNISGTLGKVETRMDKFAARSAKAGETLTKNLTLPIALLAAGTIGAAANFEKSILNIAAITRTSGTPALEEMRSKARELGETTQFSASQAAAAMGILAQSGQDSKTILETIPTVLELAAAGELELADAANIATSILAGQREGTEKLGQRTDQLVRISQSAKTEIGELGEALNISGALSKGAGQSFESTLAVLGKFADANKKGAEGGLVLRRSLSRLLELTPDAIETFKKLKFKQGDILNDDGSVKDFIGILAQLEKSGATAGQIMSIFGEIAGPTIISTIGMGTPALTKLRELIDGVSAAGARAEFAALRMAGATGGIMGFWSAVEGLAISIGDSGLLEWFTVAVKKSTEFVRSISASSPALLKWGTIISLAVAAAGPLLIMLAQLVIAGSTLAKVFGFVSASTATAAATGEAAAKSHGLLHKAMSKAIPAIWSFGKTLVTQVIPATIKWALTMGRQLVATLSSLAVRIVSTIVPAILSFGTMLVSTVIPATVAWGAALLANPIFLIGAAIAGVTLGVIYLAKNWDKAVAGMKNAFGTLFRAAKSVLDWLDEKLGVIANFIVPPWLRWLVEKFSGIGQSDVDINLRDERAASVAAGTQPISVFNESSTSSSTSVKVDFSNLPQGARVTREDSGPGGADLDLGWAMAGAL